MCGIAGFVGEGIDGQVLERMLAAIAHRGPDGSGWAAFSDSVISEKTLPGRRARSVHAAESWAALGHVRLAIIDRSEAGLQPMKGADGWWIVLNGEIYNYIELRDELASLGYGFRTGTDTEVLLAALTQWGEGCLPKLDGMFAFAAVHAGTRRILLARDRFGEKPLYHAQHGQKFLFASELPALLDGESPRRLDGEVAAGFLLDASSHQAGRSFVSGIGQLEAGCAMWIDGTGSRSPRVFRWYQLAPSSDVPRSKTEAVERFSSLMTRSVTRRLRADVPIGSCLSGGLDSSTLVALARAVAPDGSRFHAFTAVPDSEADSELHWAEQVAEHTGVVLHPVPVNSRMLESDLDSLVRVQGEPFTTLSMYNQFKVMETARREGMVVLLDGQGGDEVFLGYPRVFGVAIRQALTQGNLGAACRNWSNSIRNANLSNLQLTKMLLLSVAPAVRRVRRQRVHHLSPALVSKAIDQSAGTDTLSDLARYQLLENPLPSLLRYEDRNSMAWAVETRLPFLSHELVEASLAVPPEWMLTDGFTKWPLRKIADRTLPSSVAWRKDKMGFQAPTAKWLSQVDGRLADLGSGAHSSPLYVRQPWVDIAQGRIESRAAFRMVSLELWMRAFSISA